MIISSGDLSSVDDGNHFYRKLNESSIEESKDKIKDVLEEAYNN